MKYLIVFLAVILVSFSAGSFALAQEGQESMPKTTISPPGSVGLFFRGVGEWTSLLVTFDGEKKAEKRVAYAASYVDLAEQLNGSQDANAKEDVIPVLVKRAKKHIGKVEAYIETADEQDKARLAERGILSVVDGLKEVIAGPLASFAPPQSETRDTAAIAPDVLKAPNPAIPTDDQDRDGLPDDEERSLGTSVVEFDSDFDGISDADEVSAWGTDPKKKDTDGDGFADGIEVLNGYNPLGEGLLVESE